MQTILIKIFLTTEFNSGQNYNFWPELKRQKSPAGIFSNTQKNLFIINIDNIEYYPIPSKRADKSRFFIIGLLDIGPIEHSPFYTCCRNWPKLYSEIESLMFENI